MRPWGTPGAGRINIGPPAGRPRGGGFFRRGRCRAVRRRSDWPEEAESSRCRRTKTPWAGRRWRMVRGSSSRAVAADPVRSAARSSDAVKGSSSGVVRVSGRTCCSIKVDSGGVSR